MSKIFDALKKAEREGRDDFREEAPVVSPFVPEQLPLTHAETPTSAPPAVEPGLDLPNLVNSIDTALKDQTSRVVMFCSSIPGEGTTTVLADFAVTLSRLRGERVLVIDADTANPELPRRFRLPPGPGLSDVLTGRAGAEESIRETDLKNVYLLPAGSDIGVEGRALGSERMAKLIAVARQGFPYVLLDGGAVLTNTETPRLGRSTDGAVLVCRTFETKREIVRRAIDELSRMEIKIMGLVLNRKKEFIPNFILKRL